MEIRIWYRVNFWRHQSLRFVVERFHDFPLNNRNTNIGICFFMLLHSCIESVRVMLVAWVLSRLVKIPRSMISVYHGCSNWVENHSFHSLRWTSSQSTYVACPARINERVIDTFNNKPKRQNARPITLGIRNRFALCQSESGDEVSNIHLPYGTAVTKPLNKLMAPFCLYSLLLGFILSVVFDVLSVHS